MPAFGDEPLVARDESNSRNILRRNNHFTYTVSIESETTFDGKL